MHRDEGVPHAENDSAVLSLRRRGALATVLQKICLSSAEEGSNPGSEGCGWLGCTDARLRAWAQQQSAESTLGRCATLVHLQLLAVRKKAARESLLSSGLVRPLEDSKLTIDDARLDQALRSERDRLGGALLCSELASFFYRILDTEQGARALEYSQRFADGSIAPGDRATLEASWLLLEARLSRRPNRPKKPRTRDEVRHFLAEGVARLRSVYADDESAAQGGLDLAIAMILDMQAYLAWQQGSIEEARRLIYEAIALFSTQDEVDEIRLAMALKTAATIEAAQSNAGFELAIRWAKHSARLFRKYQHPFEWRAIQQQAQCYVKADRIEEALSVLETCRERVRNTVPAEDEIEHAYARAEMGIVQCWVEQRAVLGRRMSHGLRSVPMEDGPRRGALECWLRCAEPFTNTSWSIPERLRAEGLLQYGLAQLCDGQLPAGRMSLEQALHTARSSGRTATEMACLLGLAEGVAEHGGGYDEVLSYWRKANQLGATSTFLSTWTARLRARYRWEAAFFSLDEGWKDVEAEVLRTFLQHHLNRARYEIEGAVRSSGISKSRLYELCKVLGVPTQPPEGPKRARSSKGNPHKRRSSGPAPKTSGAEHSS